MRKSIFFALALAAGVCAAETFEDVFRQPPQEAKPWCYWWWSNGHSDEKTITSDLEAMARLGFGGLLLSDSRGYWDDEDHVLLPSRTLEVMSPEWRRLVKHAIRECRRLGLKFTMNVATSGGKMSGPWKVGADAPKRLLCRVCPASATLEAPSDFPNGKEVARLYFEAPADKIAEYVARGWYEAGDGTKTQHAGVKNDQGLRSWLPVTAVKKIGTHHCPPPSLPSTYVLRFVMTTLPGHEEDVDILDPKAVERHFNRFSGALMDEAGADLVGADKTFAGVYSVSWEGVVPMWSPDFERDFEKFAGYKIDDCLPVLAGLQPPGVDAEKFMKDYRRARNDMFRENFYGTLRRLAHARGVMMYSENGGPWNRAPEIFKEADQLKTYALNDMPQGEFWVSETGGRNYWEAPFPEMIFAKGAVSAGHVYGKRRISLESFTHMVKHWSISPSVLKGVIDRCFADGANHVVWHTFSHSPECFGVPGIEYFAGTHINRNVTWHNEAGAFLAYLTRCEALLQAGEPVVDLVICAGKTPYAGWGRYRGVTTDGAEIDAGYNYDNVSDEEYAKGRTEGEWFVLPSGMRYPAKCPAQPDLEGPFAFAHRRLGGEDLYFVQGVEKGTATFRITGRKAALFDAVSGRIEPLVAVPTEDGRTRIELDLRETGSAIVVFTSGEATSSSRQVGEVASPLLLTSHWNVSFAYHKLTHTRHLPKPFTTHKLLDFTKAADPDLKHFAGTATYRATFAVPTSPIPHASFLSLGKLPSGVAHVYVNGVDCGTVWCAPWKAAIPPGTLKQGGNELVVKYTNNWKNRLIGDCFLEPDDRVTTSNLQLLKSAVKPNGKKLNDYSGYSCQDELQPSGLLGPVSLICK